MLSRSDDLVWPACRRCGNHREPYRERLSDDLPVPICTPCTNDLAVDNRAKLEAGDPLRTCYSCLEAKDLSQFRKDSKKGNSVLLQYHCIPCDRDRRRITDNLRRGPVHDFITAQKAGKPCAECKHMWPEYVMEFDHRDPDDKKYTISSMVHTHWDTSKWCEIIEEIDKCDLVCRNCHRIRSFRSGLLGGPSKNISGEALRERRAKEAKKRNDNRLFQRRPSVS